ncbi:hypothetical protein [Pseudomonas guariconensis]|uniref:hypothetical protein n=1 Tax=Pseudomonas guariconensis TaxID=1288410 RepID=UPI002B05A941|nr:hypothetical protein [Pseudomonas guariconensis]
MTNRQPIQSIKFYALIPKANGDAEAKGTFFSVGRVDGKVTAKLWVSFWPSYIIIHQEMAEGELKSFLYKLDDIVGRVEIVEVSQ